MKDYLVFLAYLAAAVLLLFLIRTEVCTVVSINDNELAPSLKANDKVLVYRLKKDDVKKDEWVAYGDSTLHIGQVKALPGDTIQIDSLQYQIPDTCCSRCDCEGCQLILIKAGKTETLVKRKHLRGHIYRLFNLKLW